MLYSKYNYIYIFLFKLLIESFNIVTRGGMGMRMKRIISWSLGLIVLLFACIGIFWTARFGPKEATAQCNSFQICVGLTCCVDKGTGWFEIGQAAVREGTMKLCAYYYP